MIDTTDTALPYLGQQGVGGNKKKNTAVVIGVIVIIAAIVGGILMLRQPKKTDQPAVAVVEKKEPSPTEKPKIDKNTVKAQVLNGTGTPGQAGIVVEALKKAGYNSDNIKTANAKEFNTTVATIAVKDGFDDIANDVKNVLKTTFDEINIDSTHLDTSNEFDIIITTGGKKFEEATPKPTTSPTNPSISPTPTTSLTPSPTPGPTITP